MATDNQASFRATRKIFEMDDALVSSRSLLATSDGENWKKINSNFNTVDLLALQSAD